MRTTPQNGAVHGELSPKRAGPARAARHRATDRILDILELAAASRDGLALKDLSQRVETPKSSLLPLLRTLSARGYLEQGRAGEYRLGPRALELATRSQGRRELVEIARPALEALMRRTGETVFLATLGADRSAVVFIDKVESEQVIRYAAGIGDRSPLHATASGKALLAFLPEAQREEILQSLRLKRYTEHTLATLRALRESLEKIRNASVAVSIDEIVRGATGVAAPIFDRGDRVAGACTVGGPTDRVKPRLRQLAAEVKTTARSISALLGHSAPALGADGSSRRPARS